MSKLLSLLEVRAASALASPRRLPPRNAWDLVINGVREANPPDVSPSRWDEAAQPWACARVGYARGDVGSAEGRKPGLGAAIQACQSSPASLNLPQGPRALNLLVNNAGVAPKVRADLLETSEESYDYVIDTNLRGVFFLTQAFARDMVAAKKARPELLRLRSSTSRRSPRRS